MRFYLGKQDMKTLSRAQERSFLLTNGLGGYSAVSAAYSVPRCDQGILVAAVKAPNVRITMVHRMRELLRVGDRKLYLSSQSFAGRGKAEEGFRHLTGFAYDLLPVWHYHAQGVGVQRTISILPGGNTVAVRYEIENRAREDCTLQIDPFLKFAPKEEALREKKTFTYTPGAITDGTYTLYLHTDGQTRKIPTAWHIPRMPRTVVPTGASPAAAAVLCRRCPPEPPERWILFSLWSRRCPVPRRCRRSISAIRRSCATAAFSRILWHSS